MSARKKSPPLLDIERNRLFRRRLKKVFFFIFLSLALLGVVYAVFFSQLFTITVIEVSGNESVSEKLIIESVEALFQKTRLSRLMGTKNILSWRNAEFSELSQNFPEVYAVEVRRNLAERKVAIKVSERQKFAIWCEGDCFWIDNQGVIFVRAPETEGTVIKTIRVNSARRLVLGDRPLQNGMLENFSKIVKFLDDFGFVTSVLEIEDLSFKEVVAKLVRGPKIYFNLSIDPVFGKPVVESLRKNGEWEKIEYLDLRVDGRAYYKLR